MCLCVICGVCGGGGGKGGLVSSARTSILFFVLSCLRYCEGQPSLESNEHLVCLVDVKWLK